MTPLEQVLHYAYLQNAILGGLLVGVVCAILGVFVVLRGLSLLGDGLAHVSFGGVALGLTLGLYPLPVALAFSIGGAIAIHVLRERRIVRGDTAIGILFTAGLAFGILLVSRGNFGVNVNSYLFGTILAVQPVDLQVVFWVGAGLLVLLGLFQKEFFYMTYGEEAAKVSGLPVRFLNLLFMALTAAAIVVAARMVGVLLVSALLVVPAAASLQLARSFRSAVLLSAVLGVAAVLAGFWVAIANGTAAGASIALCSCGIFVLAAAAKPLLRSAR
ncbi:MAG: zinc transport system permease protein [Thermoplasmata archaeon]|nr:zinc transport system permease protein [Thermoplasmata archaeon]